MPSQSYNILKHVSLVQRNEREWESMGRERDEIERKARARPGKDMWPWSP